MVAAAGEEGVSADEAIRALIRQELESASAVRWLKISAAAERASVSQSKVREWIRLGLVEHNGATGRGSRVLASSVDRAVCTHLGRSTADDVADDLARRRAARG